MLDTVPMPCGTNADSVPEDLILDAVSLGLGIMAVSPAVSPQGRVSVVCLAKATCRLDGTTDGGGVDDRNTVLVPVVTRRVRGLGGSVEGDS